MPNKLVLLLLVLTLVCTLVHTKVIGIDFGTEFIKIGIVKPGSPVDVVLNEQSKRKSPAMVGWRGRERHLGESAKTLSTRFPTSMPKYLTLLLGKQYNKESSTMQRLQDWRFPIRLMRNRDRNGTIDVMIDDNNRYTVEELVAMIFQYVKKLASENAGSKITECVINIPPFFGASERQAILDAANVAGLHVLGLLHETTAAALQYGFIKYRNLKDVDTNKPHQVLIFDMGAASVKTVVASFNQPKKDSIDLGTMSIKGLAWAHAGGLDFDARIVEYLVKQFKQKYNIDVSSNAKVISRFFVEAKKHKEVLTSNDKSYIIIDNILDEKDLRLDFTRDLFLELCKDIIQRAVSAAEKALKDANVSISDIDALELIGGSSRVPAVQQALQTHFKKSLSFSLNGDEAIAIGSSYFAASLTSYFRVKAFAINDIFPFQIDFTLISKKPAQDADTRVFTLLKKNEDIQSKKTITIPKTEDFVIGIHYGEPVPQDSSKDIGEFEITGVQDALANLNKISQDGKKKVKVTLKLNEASLLVVDSATASVDYFVNSTEPQPQQNSTKSDSDKKKEKRTSSSNLSSSMRFIGVQPLTEQQKTKSRERLDQLNEIDYFRQQLAKHRNDLESYIYSTRYQLVEPMSSASEDYTPFYSKAEIAKIQQELERVDTWFSSEAPKLEETQEPRKVMDAYRANLNSLVDLCEPIYMRYNEKNDREKAFKFCAQTLNATRSVIDLVIKNTPHLTANDTKDVYVQIDETELWVKEKQDKQAATPLNVAPVVKAADVEARCRRTNASLMRTAELLASKPKPEIPKPTTNETTTGNSTTPENKDKPQNEKKTRDEL